MPARNSWKSTPTGIQSRCDGNVNLHLSPNLIGNLAITLSIYLSEPSPNDAPSSLKIYPVLTFSNGEKAAYLPTEFMSQTHEDGTFYYTAELPTDVIITKQIMSDSQLVINLTSAHGETSSHFLLHDVPRRLMVQSRRLHLENKTRRPDEDRYNALLEPFLKRIMHHTEKQGGIAETENVTDPNFLYRAVSLLPRQGYNETKVGYFSDTVQITTPYNKMRAKVDIHNTSLPRIIVAMCTHVGRRFFVEFNFVPTEHLNPHLANYNSIRVHGTLLGASDAFDDDLVPTKTDKQPSIMLIWTWTFHSDGTISFEYA